MRIRWLQISDIHQKFYNYNTAVLRGDLLTRIRAHKESEPFTHLFLTGDLLQKNQNTLDEVVEFVKSIIQATGASKDSVHIVPGNHDKNRDIASPIIDSIYSSGKQDEVNELIDGLSEINTNTLLGGFENFFNVYSSIMGTQYYLEFDNPHQVFKDIHNGISIVKLNTAWLERNSKEFGLLRCGTLKLKEALDSSELNNKSITIAIGHHPLNYFEPNEKIRILNQLERNSVLIYLCGHVHKPTVNYYSSSDLVEIACNSAVNDGYSVGGYIVGTIDTDINCYKVEFFRWNENGWYTEFDIPNTNENGIYYFNTRRFKHSTNKIAVAFKMLGTQVSRKEVEMALGDSSFEMISYPYSNIDVSSIDWDIHKLTTIEMANQLISLTEKDISIFPMAPIPLLILLGYNLQNNSKVTIFQYDRENYRWAYTSNIKEEIEIEVTEKINQTKGLILKIATSTQILDEHIERVINLNGVDILSISTEITSLGYPLYKETVSGFLKVVQQRLSQIANNYDEIHLFASVPAGLAVELGRRFQKGVYPKIHLYNYQQGYDYVFSIN